MPEIVESPPFPSFREAYCHVFQCPSEDFPRHALVRAVPGWRRGYVVPAILAAPTIFGLDQHILELLGNTRSKHEFSQLLDEFHNAIRVTRSWSKKWLGLRMSGGRLIELRDKLDPLILPGDRETMLPAVSSAPALAPVTPRPIVESRAVIARRVRQAVDALLDGGQPELLLKSAGWTEAEFLRHLSAEAPSQSRCAWVHDQWLRNRRLTAVESELNVLKLELAARERDLADLRERLARRIPG